MTEERERFVIKVGPVNGRAERERGGGDGKTRRAEEINRQIKRAIKIQRREFGTKRL